VLQLVFVNPVYELHRDEFLHLDQAFHASAGYISVPPFTSWMSRIIYLFGGDLFWIRLIPALFGAITIVYAWLIIEELEGKLYAKILCSAFLIFSVYVRLNVLYQPNSFDILAWTMVFYYLIRYVKTQDTKWLFVLAIVTALGLYNKYTIVFLIFGIGSGLVLTNQRIIFTKKAFYMATGLCLLIFMPNIIWQISHHFPVIHHMQALNDNQLVNNTYIDFLIGQVRFGVIGILSLAALWALLFYKPFKPYRFIGWTFIIVLALFTFTRAKSYYALGLYPVLFSLGSIYLETMLRKWKAVVVPLLVVLNAATFFAIVPYLMPFQCPAGIIANREAYEKYGLLRWEDGKNHTLPQDFADMIGWKEMAEKSLEAYQMIPTHELENTLVFCDNYGQTGALNYYNRKKMPEAYSFNTDYIYWLPDLEKIENVLLVGNKPDQEVIDLFTAFKTVGIVENEFAREKGTKIFLLLGAKPEFTGLFYKMAEERKRKFNIF
jgi:hypothetical protein